MRNKKNCMDPSSERPWTKWLIVFGAFLSYFMADGCTYSFSVLYTDLMLYYGQSSQDTAALPGLLYGIPQWFGPLVFSIINTVGCAPASAVGALLIVISYSSAYYAPSLYYLYFSIGVVTSFGLQLVYSAAIMIVSTMFIKHRSLATGITVSGSGIGILVVAPLLTYLKDIYSWKGAMLIMSGIFLHILLAAVIFHVYQTAPQQEQIFEKSENLELEESCTLEKKPMRSRSEADILNQNLDFKIDDVHQAFKATRSHSQTFLARGAGARRMSDQLPRNLPSPTLPVNQRSSLLRKAGEQYQSRNANLDEDSVAEIEHKSENTKSQARSGSKFQNFLTDFKTSLLGLLDARLWTNPFFMLFCVSNTLMALWIIVPWTFLYTRATTLGMAPQKAALMQSLMGGCSAIGQLLLGYAGDHINPALLYAVSLTTTGAVMVAMGCLDSSVSLFILSGIFGLSNGALYALLSVISVHLVGIDLLYAALGVFSPLAGTANLVGTPLAGFIRDKTGSYSMAFVAGGITIMVSCLLLIPVVIHIHKQRNATKINSLESVHTTT